MQAQASKPQEVHRFYEGENFLLASQLAISAVQSLQTVQTLLRAGMGCITYLRYLKVYDVIKLIT
jgi:hypothetical protein